VEQIYSFIDSSQDFREGTLMRLLYVRTSNLLQIPLNSLIIIHVNPSIPNIRFYSTLFRWCTIISTPIS